MDKIIIDPHHCSAEEYVDLQDYLTDNHWDWQKGKIIHWTDLRYEHSR